MDEEEHATVREMVSEAMAVHGDSFDDVVYISPQDLDLEYSFDSGYGEPECPCFILWTTSRVYFPQDYDGADHVMSAPRHPCEETLGHHIRDKEEGF